MSWVQPVNDGRRQEVSAAFHRLTATQDDLGAFGGRVGHMFLHLVDGIGIDQRAKGGAVLQAVADLHRAYFLFQLGGEGVIDTGLHIDPVGADTGLAVVAEFAHDRAFDGGIQIGVVENDEGRVAAQFHRAFHHAIRRLAQQDAAHLGRTGEGQLAHGVVFAEFLADVSTAREEVTMLNTPAGIPARSASTPITVADSGCFRRRAANKGTALRPAPGRPCG